MLPRDTITRALERADGAGPALVAFVTAGYPAPGEFLDVLRAVGSVADAVEIGVPFSDPMADGVTVQRSSHAAIEHGVTLRWILDELGRSEDRPRAPLLLMSYLNPLLAFGYAELAERAAAVGVAGFIVPDLPLEESGPLHEALAGHGLALVQLVTPATPAERLARLAAASEGFVYAVARTGITGAAGASVTSDDVGAYLDAVRAVSKLPVCVGFGVRDVEQVRWLGRHADGVIVGSALVEVLERGDDPAAFLRALRPTS